MKNLARLLLFPSACLVCLLFLISRIWKRDAILAGRIEVQPMIAETRTGSVAELDDPVSSIIQSGFNRDSLLLDFSIGRQRVSFNVLREVELLTINTSNGIQLLADDLTNVMPYLRSPESVSYLIPALVCDVVFYCVSFGSAESYSTLMKWREEYVKQHPGACLLVFHNAASGLHPRFRLTFKLLNDLYLIKAISDGRIITRTKYDKLLQSGLMSTPTSDIRRPVLKHEDENSIKEFIRLLTPHMSTGIGIPSNADMSQYPTMMFLDMDTLFTNKSITVPKFLQRIDDGLKLQPILSAHKNETLSDDLIPAPYSSAAADFVISTDIGCNEAPFCAVNSGVLLSRPTSTVANLLMFAIHHRFRPGSGDEGRKGDQGALIWEMERMSDFNSSHMVTECTGGPRWYLPEYKNRIVFVSVLSDSTDPDDQTLAKEMAELNRKRNEHMESIWGPPLEPLKGLRVPLVVVVNEQWCNSMYKGNDSDWHPGDWIAHFTGFKKERIFGEPLRRWVCDNLDSVSHPEDWPSTPNDCPLLIKEGFNDMKGADEKPKKKRRQDG